MPTRGDLLTVGGGRGGCIPQAEEFGMITPPPPLVCAARTNTKLRDDSCDEPDDDSAVYNR